jgi:hypothetical protein
MTSRRLIHRLSSRLLTFVVAGCAAASVLAQSDPPARVGRLNHAEGAVTFSTTGDNEWIDAQANRPLTRGDRLWTDTRARAEIQIGSSAVRMDGQTKVEVMVLDDQATQLSVTQGSVYVRIRSLPEGENFEIDTPNLAYRAAYPGDYRIDVDPVRGTTRVTIHSGTGAVYGEAGQSLALGGGQQITFKARSLAQMGVQESPPQDNFDRWAAERNRREDQSVSARHVPREVVGYQQLDSHGQWQQDSTHGTVWYPAGTPANWAPYRHGRWDWLEPWGWTWIDDAPWGFAPFHYGRWTVIGSKWAWVPGRIGLRPVYAPALVAFLGGSTGGVNWSTTIGAGKPSVAWFPLAPGEAWQPSYRASPVYMSNLNRGLTVSPNASYAHQRRPDALTAISAEDFHRGRPAKGNWLRVAGNMLGGAQVVPPPPMPERSRTAVARTAPVTEIKQIGSAQASAQQQIAEALRQKQAADLAAQQAQQTLQSQREQAQRAEQARLAQQQQQLQQQQLLAQQQRQLQLQQQQQQQALQQARTAEQTRALEQARAAEQVKAALEAQRTNQTQAAERSKAAGQARAVEQQQARVAPEAQRAEQRKAAAEARAAERTRLAEAAKEQAQQRRQAQEARASAAARAAPAKSTVAAARAAQAAKLAEARKAEGARRDLQARRAADVKREQTAKREQVRNELLARRDLLEQARREALARADQQAKRDKAEQARREAVARKEEEIRRVAYVEQARRAADRDAQALREQRIRREEQMRREDLAREQAQREAWQRQQQLQAEQLRRDQWEQQRARGRPDLRNDRQTPPEVWQRGIPVLSPGRTS